MKTRDIYQLRRTSLAIFLVAAPCLVQAAGFEVNRTHRDHSITAAVSITSTERYGSDLPAYAEEGHDRKDRRVRLIQSNSGEEWDPVSDWSHEFVLENAAVLPNGSVSSESVSKVETEASRTSILHRAELSYDWQHNSPWDANASGSATSLFSGSFLVAEPLTILVESYIHNTGASGMPGLMASITNSNGAAIWEISWPMDRYGLNPWPSGSEVSHVDGVTTVRVGRSLKLSPGDYRFSSTVTNAYLVGANQFSYDSAGAGFFSITAVPETQSIAMALAGLLVMGAVWRTRRTCDAASD